MFTIANIFTLANLIAGCIAITAVANQNHEWVLYAILVSLIADVLDGMIARMEKSDSGIGVFLDSLADMVSFGVLPGIMINYLLQGDDFGTMGPLIIPAYVFIAAAALRLARFSMEENEGTHFNGMPTPAASMIIFALYFSNAYNYEGLSFIQEPYFLMGLAIVLALLMISNIGFLSAKKFSGDLKKEWPRIALVVLAIISFIFFKYDAAVLIFVIYFILSFIALRK